MIRIISKVDGFRRGGIEHSALPTEYPEGTFTREQLAVLRAEPMLLVDLLPDTSPSDLLSVTDDGRTVTASTPTVTVNDLDDLNTEELLAVARQLTGAELDPKTDWFDLRDQVAALISAKATAELGQEA